jgi:membrane-associated protease RseP (regulator of RpoE activity)
MRPPLPAPDDLHVPDVQQPPRERRAKYLILFVLTLITATLAGAWYHAGFRQDFGNRPVSITFTEYIVNGLWYAIPALLILGAHEFGHYFACRYYGIRASLPYFLPVWFPVSMPQFGTFGAVIRIRQPIRIKQQLFDIGIAGPLAGFVVIVPVLVAGFALSRLAPLPADFVGYDMGTPLLFRGVSWLRFGEIPPGYEVNIHPMAWAAWFGLLATALNLAPVGQLDGGHIAYAVLGRKSIVVTIGVVVSLVGLSVVTRGAYAVWTGLIVAMLLVLGPHHPHVIDEDIPLDRKRLWLAALALLILIVSFTPIPIRPWTGS